MEFSLYVETQFLLFNLAFKIAKTSPVPLKLITRITVYVTVHVAFYC